MKEASVRLTILCFFVALLATVPASAGDLRWETWGENAVAGGGSEGAHVWVTHGLYERGRELGLGKAEASTLALVVMAAWEVYEVEEMDAKGVSVQDFVANAAGVIAGIVGLDVHYSFAALTDPPGDPGKPWTYVPALPRNDSTYAIEVDAGGLTLGYKFLGDPGDLVIGTTTMPVLAGETGRDKIVGFVGRAWPNGWHCALGFDGIDGLSVGGGYRRSVCGPLGIDLTALASPDESGFGLSVFVNYDSVFR